MKFLVEWSSVHVVKPKLDPLNTCCTSINNEPAETTCGGWFTTEAVSAKQAIHHFKAAWHNRFAEVKATPIK